MYCYGEGRYRLPLVKFDNFFQHNDDGGETGHNIDFRKGNGSILLGSVLSVLALFLMMIIMESVNLFYGASIAQTRADLIADGAASYGISCDDTLDRGQVILMSSLLLASSAGYEEPISMRIDYNAINHNEVHVEVTSKNKLWFPKSQDTFKVTREATTRIVP